METKLICVNLLNQKLRNYLRSLIISFLYLSQLAFFHRKQYFCVNYFAAFYPFSVTHFFFGSHRESFIKRFKFNSFPPPYRFVSVKFAKIVGSSEIHVKVGSTISLTCVVNHQVPSIQW